MGRTGRIPRRKHLAASYGEPRPGEEVWKVYGVFGGYTRWAVVFLIIFVLFFLLVPGYGAAAGY